MTDFNGKAILITGGGSGIGLGTARRLVSAGASVVLAGRDASRLDSAAKSLDAGDRVLTVPTDVSRLDDLDRLMAATGERLGHLDGLFVNAGTGVSGRAADMTEAMFDLAFDTNVKGSFFTVAKALPLLADDASVVLNASWTLHRGLAPAAVYSASKAAVLNLARTLAADLAGRGIRVNAVTPGHIDTDMFSAIAPVPEVREFFRSQVVLGRLGQPEDVAGAVTFLLSPQAAYITGSELVVDGGLVSSIPG